MVIEVGKITKSREAARKAADDAGADVASVLELRYIADTLEAIRAEFVGFQHLFGMVARQQPPK